MITNPKIREWVYIAQTGLGLVLLVVVALGLVGQDTSLQIGEAVGALVLMLTGEMARRNVAPAPTIDTTAGIVKALAQQQASAVVGGLAGSVDQVRRDLEARLGSGR